VKLTSQEKHWNQATFLTGDGIKYPRKGIYNFKNQTSWQKGKSMTHFVFLSFYFGARNGSPALGMANSLVLRRVSSGRIIVVLFWTKYAVPRQIKPGILKLTTRTGQRNLCTVFIFVSCEEKGCYRIVSLRHQNFDCRSYCGLSRRMQGAIWKCPNLQRNVRPSGRCPTQRPDVIHFSINSDVFNRCISVKTSLINTKLGNLLNLGVPPLTMWINSYLSHNLETCT